MPQIILKSPGQPVADFSVSGNVVVVSGLEIDCAQRQEDSALVIEVRQVAGEVVEGGQRGSYLAHIAIPPREYDTTTTGEGEEETQQTIKPLDHNAVVVTLWPTV